jgi:pimeloyl-ACP methyl ester carboxylesterase
MCADLLLPSFELLFPRRGLTGKRGGVIVAESVDHDDASANNDASSQIPVTTPLLYLRGDKEGGQISDYVDGLRSAGLTHVDHALVPNAGHFTQEEAPQDTWRLIAEFAGT